MNLRTDSFKNRLNKAADGFTLIEVMVAMLILTGSIVTLTTSWSGNFFRINKAQLNHNVAELLQRKITEIELLNNGKSFEEIKEEDKGTFKNYPNYRWSMSSQEFEMPDLQPLLAAQGGELDETLSLIINQMGEHIKKSVKEVKVSIFVKYKGKEAEFSATTYFVDYEKELDLGSLGALAGSLGGGGLGGGGDGQ